MKKIAISGATGAIGMALIEKCIEEGTQVIVFVRSNSARKNRIPKNKLITVIEIGLEDLADYEDKIRRGCADNVNDISDIDVFYHFAWNGTTGASRNDMYLQNMNVKYTLDAVKLAKAMGAKTFIGAGSQAEYGRVEGVLQPDTPVNPENGYGMAKLCAGHMSRVMCEQLSMAHVWTRILSVYGPYDGEKSMITSVIRKLLNGDKPSLTRGEQKWDYLYSLDAANAMYLLGERSIELDEPSISGRTYCIGSGVAKPLSEYIRMMRDAIDSDLELGFGEIPYAEKQVMNLCADIKDLTHDTGFLPKVDFEKGIKNTIDFIKNN